MWNVEDFWKENRGILSNAWNTIYNIKQFLPKTKEHKISFYF